MTCKARMDILTMAYVFLSTPVQLAWVAHVNHILLVRRDII